MLSLLRKNLLVETVSAFFLGSALFAEYTPLGAGDTLRRIPRTHELRYTQVCAGRTNVFARMRTSLPGIYLFSCKKGETVGENVDTVQILPQKVNLPKRESAGGLEFSSIYELVDLLGTNVIVSQDLAGRCAYRFKSFPGMDAWAGPDFSERLVTVELTNDAWARLRMLNVTRRSSDGWTPSYRNLGEEGLTWRFGTQAAFKPVPPSSDAIPATFLLLGTFSRKNLSLVLPGRSLVPLRGGKEAIRVEECEAKHSCLFELFPLRDAEFIQICTVTEGGRGDAASRAHPVILSLLVDVEKLSEGNPENAFTVPFLDFFCFELPFRIGRGVFPDYSHIANLTDTDLVLTYADTFHAIQVSCRYRIERDGGRRIPVLQQLRFDRKIAKRYGKYSSFMFNRLLPRDLRDNELLGFYAEREEWRGED